MTFSVKPKRPKVRSMTKTICRQAADTPLQCPLLVVVLFCFSPRSACLGSLRRSQRPPALCRRLVGGGAAQSRSIRSHAGRALARAGCSEPPVHPPRRPIGRNSENRPAPGDSRQRSRRPAARHLRSSLMSPCSHALTYSRNCQTLGASPAKPGGLPFI